MGSKENLIFSDIFFRKVKLFLKKHELFSLSFKRKVKWHLVVCNQLFGLHHLRFHSVILHKKKEKSDIFMKICYLNLIVLCFRYFNLALAEASKFTLVFFYHNHLVRYHTIFASPSSDRPKGSFVCLDFFLEL